MKHNTEQQTHWADLLEQAVREPGVIHQAYSRFWNYSSGNQLSALMQCAARGIEPGPIATYPKWQEVGRQVQKGEKALTLCMPVTRKKESVDQKDEETIRFFIFRARWFVLAQTAGQPFEPPPVPGWDRLTALETLNISEIPFDLLDGNVQGFARHRSISISPVAALPHKTTFHELAHILLGHTSEGGLLSDGDWTPKSLREAEAESVALICCESLGLPGAEFSRGYIQNWLSGATIPERSAQKIFHAADQILKAGRQS